MLGGICLTMYKLHQETAKENFFADASGEVE